MQLQKRELEDSGALFDLSGHYRYLLWRSFPKGSGQVTFVMLNPNNADEKITDPTIARCARFAKDWGYQRLEVVNLFGLKARYPRQLLVSKDPVGRHNEEIVVESLRRADKIIIAWGNYGNYLNRSKDFLHMAKQNRLNLQCLQVNSTGEPKHPLYIAKTCKPIDYLI